MGLRTAAQRTMPGHLTIATSSLAAQGPTIKTENWASLLKYVGTKCEQRLTLKAGVRQQSGIRSQRGHSGLSPAQFGPPCPHVPSELEGASVPWSPCPGGAAPYPGGQVHAVVQVPEPEEVGEAVSDVERAQLLVPQSQKPENAHVVLVSPVSMKK